LHSLRGLKRIVRIGEEVASSEGAPEFSCERTTKAEKELVDGAFSLRLGQDIVCLNEEEPRKDAHDRQAIVAHLRIASAYGDESLLGNKGYRPTSSWQIGLKVWELPPCQEFFDLQSGILKYYDWACRLRAQNPAATRSALGVPKGSRRNSNQKKGRLIVAKLGSIVRRFLENLPFLANQESKKSPVPRNHPLKIR